MMRTEVEYLWKTCFHDTDEFIQFYFDRKYRDENTLVARDEEGRAVSALQMLPYPMTFGSTVVDTSYISGACTLPEARSRGIMRDLLGKAFLRMRSRGVAFSTLIPQENWLYDYYARVGYAPVFEVIERSYSPVGQDVPEGLSLEVARDLGEVDTSWFGYFSERNRLRDFCVQHPREDFEAVLLDLFAGNGRLIVVRQGNGNVVGMAFAFLDGGRIRVNDWFYDSQQVRAALLAGMSVEFGPREVVCREVVREGDGMRRGMARVIDVEQVLRLHAEWSKGDGVCLIHLEDEYVTRNTGLYLLEGATCRRVEKSPGLPEISMTIGELTRFVMSGGKNAPFMSLMLD